MSPLIACLLTSRDKHFNSHATRSGQISSAAGGASAPSSTVSLGSSAASVTKVLCQSHLLRLSLTDWGDYSAFLAPIAGPGHWHDPDVSGA